MNILYTNFHVHGGGGHDTYLKTLSQNTQHNIYIACPATSTLYHSLSQSKFANLIAFDFPSKPKDVRKIYQATRQLANIINNKKIDIIHTNGSADNRIALYAKLFTKRKIKIVFTRHNSLPINELISRWRWLRCNDGAIFVSQSIFKTIGCTVNPDQISVIKNGIDTEYWHSAAPTIPSNVIKLVSTAGTANYKGWQYLINALKLLPKHQREKFQVTIVGNLPDAKTINQLCHGDSLSEQVSFTGFTREPKTFLIDADIGFVLSDAIETISFACREMMAMGLPMIVSDYGGLPENITVGQDGWVVPTANIQAIAQLLAKIADMDKTALVQMKLNARQKAEKEFSIIEMIEQTNRFYQRLAS